MEETIGRTVKVFLSSPLTDRMASPRLSTLTEAARLTPTTSPVLTDSRQRISELELDMMSQSTPDSRQHRQVTMRIKSTISSSVNQQPETS